MVSETSLGSNSLIACCGKSITLWLLTTFVDAASTGLDGCRNGTMQR